MRSKKDIVLRLNSQENDGTPPLEFLANKLSLRLASPFFAELIASCPEDQQGVLNISGIQGSLLLKVLEFIHFGSATFTRDSVADGFLGLVNSLGIQCFKQVRQIAPPAEETEEDHQDVEMEDTNQLFKQISITLSQEFEALDRISEDEIVEDAKQRFNSSKDSGIDGSSSGDNYEDCTSCDDEIVERDPLALDNFEGPDDSLSILDDAHADADDSAHIITDDTAEELSITDDSIHDVHDTSSVTISDSLNDTPVFVTKDIDSSAFDDSAVIEDSSTDSSAVKFDDSISIMTEAPADRLEYNASIETEIASSAERVFSTVNRDEEPVIVQENSCPEESNSIETNSTALEAVSLEKMEENNSFGILPAKSSPRKAGKVQKRRSNIRVLTKSGICGPYFQCHKCRYWNYSKNAIKRHRGKNH